MPNYAEYFKSNRSQPTWFIGDRVSGRWNKIPFIGTVGNGVTFTGALSGATIVSESSGGGSQLTYLGVTGAGNNDWTTTYQNINVGV